MTALSSSIAVPWSRLSAALGMVAAGIEPVAPGEANQNEPDDRAIHEPAPPGPWSGPCLSGNSDTCSAPHPERGRLSYGATLDENSGGHVSSATLIMTMRVPMRSRNDRPAH